MRFFTHFALALSLGVCLLGFIGCDSPKETSKETTSADKSGDDHKGHDHEGHDHADKGDHAGHDHAGHDHDGEVDAQAAGLSTDDLVSLDEPEIPDNFNDAVAELSKLVTTIDKGMMSGKIEDAHGPLHDVSNLLEGINALAQESSMSDDTKEDVANTIDDLFDDYGDVDLKLHQSKKGKDYADVADDIKASLKTLQGYAKE